MNKETLESVARQLVAPGKGILAADESGKTIEKRLAKVGVASTEDTRRAYRELLFTTPEIENCISGVILYDETIRQQSVSGAPLLEILLRRGIIPGIKVDKGTAPLALAAPGELVTEGLDGLRERLVEYKSLGAQFAKWRAVITIGPDMPSDYCLRVNAFALARYAALCQENDLVPIVEPEVLMEGGHSIERCAEVTEQTLAAVFAELTAERVMLSGILLKPNMVVAGKDAGRAEAATVAEMTLTIFKKYIPDEAPGIVFLSGGQSEVEATENLQAINAARGDAPWRLSFSFGRALQASALETWSGKSENVAAAQREFQRRARLNGLATRGEYAGEG